MSKIYKVKSPAKINIGLRVLSKRKDGFHNIETIFYPLAIFDEISVKISKTTGNNKISVKTNLKGNINGKNNICYKAAELFLNQFKIVEPHRIEIKIKKNIPTGAGLGGGSSNAASALLILQKHFRLKKINKQLLKLAAGIGSDVPFFLSGKAAYAAGRGEKLSPLPEFKIRKKILVVNPGVHISTPWAYNELKVKGNKSKSLNRIKKFDINNNCLMINEFERVVFKKYPKIEKLKYDMYMQKAEFALMSGSGSTVYGLFSNKNIKAAEKYFRGLGYSVFIS